MIPPMNETVILDIEDKSKPKDRYGKYPTTPKNIKANVRHTSRVVYVKEGLNRQATLTIKLMPIELEEGQMLTAIDQMGIEHKVTILTLKDITNFGNNRIIYREISCGA